MPIERNRCSPVLPVSTRIVGEREYLCSNQSASVKRDGWLWIHCKCYPGGCDRRFGYADAMTDNIRWHPMSNNIGEYCACWLVEPAVALIRISRWSLALIDRQIIINSTKNAIRFFLLLLLLVAAVVWRGHKLIRRHLIQRNYLSVRIGQTTTRKNGNCRLISNTASVLCFSY